MLNADTVPGDAAATVNTSVLRGTMFLTARYLKNGIFKVCSFLFTVVLVHFLFIATPSGFSSAKISVIESQSPTQLENDMFLGQSALNIPILVPGVMLTTKDGERNFVQSFPNFDSRNSLNAVESDSLHSMSQHFNQNPDNNTGHPKQQYLRSSSRLNLGTTYSHVALSSLVGGHTIQLTEFMALPDAVSATTVYPVSQSVEDPTLSPEQNSDG